jgi:hypothetical protein
MTKSPVPLLASLLLAAGCAADPVSSQPGLWAHHPCEGLFQADGHPANLLLQDQTTIKPPTVVTVLSLLHAGCAGDFVASEPGG